MAEIHSCTYCHKKKLGQWIVKSKPGHWGKKSNLQTFWVCHDTPCQEKAGLGTTQSVEGTGALPTMKQSITHAITPSGNGAQVAHEAATYTLALLPTYQVKVAHLVVETPEDYELADALLGQLNDLRKGWGSIYKRLEEKVVKPLRSVLDEVYKVNRDVDRPIEALVTGIKAKMGDYKRREIAAQNAINEARDREEAKLRAEAEEAQRQAEAAKTPQMKGRLEKKAEDLAGKADQVLQQSIEDAPQSVVGQHSGIRQKTLPRVTELALFLVGIIEGTIPEDMIIVDQRKLEQAWKQDLEGVAKWPGVTVSSEIGIVSR